MKKRLLPVLIVLLILAVFLALFLLGRDPGPQTNPSATTSVPTAGPTTTPTTTPTAGPTTVPTTAPTTAPSTTPSTAPTSGPTTAPSQPTICSHQWSDWSVTKAPACDEKGVKSRTCSKCGETETQAIAAAGHSWDGGKVTTTTTVCGDVGVKTFTCKTCGGTKTEQITGNHTFGDWEYEEYTYKYIDFRGKERTQVSHRKVRYCTKCNYKETGNTENHSCKIGSGNHTVTIEREGTCQQVKVYRTTCNICGWSTTYDNGEYGDCVVTTTKKHLTDYGNYTNELDVTIYKCSVCGGVDYAYTVGKGLERYRMKYNVNCNAGTAYAGQGVSGYTDTRLIDHPTWQFVTRNEKFDSEGYLIQWDYIWHDKNGNRYSQTIKMEDIPAMFEAAGYNLDSYAGKTISFHLIVDGNRIRPYKISWVS